MPTAINATAGDPGQNAYATVAEVTTYFDDRPQAGTTWSGADPDDQIRAVLYATKLMDALFVWTGHTADPGGQGLLWPRVGMWYRSGESVPSNIIPDELKDALAEYCREVLAGDRTADNPIETLGLKKLKAGPVALEWDEDTAAKVVPDVVVNLLPDDWFTSISGRNQAIRQLSRV
jgi:hypothetical protein